MKKITVLLLLFVFFAVGVRAEEKKFTLKNRYPQGKYEMVMNMDSTEPKEIEMGPAKMTYKNVSMENESTLLMEVETGLVVSNVSDMTMSMDMETQVGDQTMEQKITGTGKTTVTITRAKTKGASEN